jgi:hypothetical protein
MWDVKTTTAYQSGNPYGGPLGGSDKRRLFSDHAEPEEVMTHVSKAEIPPPETGRETGNRKVGRSGCIALASLTGSY